MTFAPEHRKLKPGEKLRKITVGEFKTFTLPIIRGKEPSAVDRLAAVVDEEARKRVERAKHGTWPKMNASDMVRVQPMTQPVHRRRQSR